MERPVSDQKQPQRPSGPSRAWKDKHGRDELFMPESIIRGTNAPPVVFSDGPPADTAPPQPVRRAR